jgi:NADH-quinone oxidoreductase subunit M
MSAAVLASTGLLASEEAASVGFPLLAFIVLLPVVGALGIALSPRSRPELARLLALATSIGTAVLCVFMLTQFKSGVATYQFVTSVDWIKQLDIKFILGVDGISLFLVVLTGVLFPIALFAAKPGHDEKAYYAWITLLEAGCLGVFLALDLFLFFIMFEITIVPLYMLIGQWGHGRRVYAANKFFIYTLGGSVLMLVSIVVLAVQAKAGVGGGVSFDLQKVVASHEVSQTTARWLFLGFAAAFAVKTPIFPFHTWLPDAHTEAPTAGSIDLASVVLKLGTYGFLRYALYLFPEASTAFAPYLMGLAVVGIIYGAIVAAMQKNLKRLVAYSSVSHMGFAILGLFSLTTIGIEGSIMVMVNHGIATGALFVLLGYIYSRRHTYDIASLNGLQKVAPWLAGLFTVVMLASIGVPGLNGFVGEFLSLLGAYANNRAFAIVAAAGVIIAARYLLWAYQRVFHGEPSEENKRFPDLSTAEKMVMAPLIALIVFLGVYPKPLLDRIEPSVQLVIERLEIENPGWKEPSNDTPAVPAEGQTHGGEAAGTPAAPTTVAPATPPTSAPLAAAVATTGGAR